MEMSRGRWDTDDDLDDWPEDEADDGLRDCPYCGEEMYDDSIRCPNCGRYLSTEDGGEEKKPPWIMITAVVLLVVMLSWLANYF
jgi:hypothetical protein